MYSRKHITCYFSFSFLNLHIIPQFCLFNSFALFPHPFSTIWGEPAGFSLPPWCLQLRVLVQPWVPPVPSQPQSHGCFWTVLMGVFHPRLRMCTFLKRSIWAATKFGVQQVCAATALAAVRYFTPESRSFAHQRLTPSRLSDMLVGCPYRDEPSYFRGVPYFVLLHISLTVWLSFIYVATSPISISEFYIDVMMEIQIEATCFTIFFSIEKPTVHLFFDMLKRMISVFQHKKYYLTPRKTTVNSWCTGTSVPQISHITLYMIQ